MAQLSKTMRVPEFETIETFDDLKRYLRELMVELEKMHRVLRNDILTQTIIEVVSDTGNWRRIVDGDDLIFQKKVGDTWTTGFRIKGS